MDEDQSQELELEALSAIMGDDMWSDGSGTHGFFVQPECDASAETVGAVILVAVLPQAYPQLPADFRIQSLSDRLWTERYPHRTVSSWRPSAEQATALSRVVLASAEGRTGQAVLWDAVEAVRQWLETNTLAANPGADVVAEVSKEVPSPALALTYRLTQAPYARKPNRWTAPRSPRTTSISTRRTWTRR